MSRALYLEFTATDFDPESAKRELTKAGITGVEVTRKGIKIQITDPTNDQLETITRTLQPAVTRTFSQFSFPQTEMSTYNNSPIRSPPAYNYSPPKSASSPTRSAPAYPSIENLSYDASPKESCNDGCPIGKPSPNLGYRGYDPYCSVSKNNTYPRRYGPYDMPIR